MIGELIARIPDSAPPAVPGLDEAIGDSVAYLRSDAALRSIEADTYWPKWSSPWWHMVLLWELGEAQRIPPAAIRAMIDGLNALPVKVFPIAPGDAPEGYDPRRDISCHCALGSIAQVLHACGIDVARELPWAKPFFVRSQMADGGLNCDEFAYRVAGECPSSMVGTIAAFEAMLTLATTPAEQLFVEHAATFLVERGLVRGSDSTHNAEERDAAPKWMQPTFPRFYFYDVLRGLAALVRWDGATHGRRIPALVIEPVVRHLVSAYPDGIVRIERRAFAGLGTLAQTPSGWERQPTASTFPLLDAVSVLGAPSMALTRQWKATRHRLRTLIDRGQLA